MTSEIAQRPRRWERAFPMVGTMAALPTTRSQIRRKIRRKIRKTIRRIIRRKIWQTIRRKDRRKLRQTIGRKIRRKIRQISTCQRHLAMRLGRPACPFSVDASTAHGKCRVYLESPADYHVPQTKLTRGPSLSAGQSLFLLMELSPC
jgi:hypothetical protein